MTDTTSDRAASGVGLSPDEVEIFARGLYYIAACDGIDPREEQLIREFLGETGSSLTWEDLTSSAFSVGDALGLETTFVRHLFLKVAIALVKADGTYSDKERHVLGEIADVFGVSNAQFGDLEQAAGQANLAG
jgi:tellurite resistance protein